MMTIFLLHGKLLLRVHFKTMVLFGEIPEFKKMKILLLKYLFCNHNNNNNSNKSCIYQLTTFDLSFDLLHTKFIPKID